jgi:DNA-binding MarR family transcriptional regulator
MSDSLYDLHDCLGFMTFTANRKMGAFLHHMMKKAGANLTSEQWGVLIQLWNQKSVTQEELAYVSCVDKSTMSRALSRMERNGLIERRADPADARRKILRPTRKADALKERSVAATREMLARALENVAPHDRVVTLKVLAAVKENVRKYCK